MIAVTISHSLEGTDLIVDAFESASRDGKVVPVEDAGSVSFQGVGHRLQGPNTGCPSAGTPVCKEHTSGQFVGLLPDSDRDPLSDSRRSPAIDSGGALPSVAPVRSSLHPDPHYASAAASAGPSELSGPSDQLRVAGRDAVLSIFSFISFYYMKAVCSATITSAV